VAIARSRLGCRYLTSALDDDAVVRFAVNTISDQIAADSGFGDVEGRVDSFEDCVGLLSSNQLNHGVSRLMISEAAYLFRLVRSLDEPAVVEIGRFRGGTTLLLAAAGGRVLSLDIDPASTERDATLRRALETRGLADRVTLVIGDSRTYDVAPESQDIVFIDGDHSYEGARADVERWLPSLRPGGHLLLHDGMVPEPARPWAHPWKVEGVLEVCAELAHDPRLALVGRAGTIADFVVPRG
jgi:predicted O-methyltransferase YrrM